MWGYSEVPVISSTARYVASLFRLSVSGFTVRSRPISLVGLVFTCVYDQCGGVRRYRLYFVASRPIALVCVVFSVCMMSDLERGVGLFGGTRYIKYGQARSKPISLVCLGLHGT